jgi:hypothetical protein
MNNLKTHKDHFIIAIILHKSLEIHHFNNLNNVIEDILHEYYKHF